MKGKKEIRNLDNLSSEDILKLLSSSETKESPQEESKDLNTPRKMSDADSLETHDTKKQTTGINPLYEKIKVVDDFIKSSKYGPNNTIEELRIKIKELEDLNSNLKELLQRNESEIRSSVERQKILEAQLTALDHKNKEQNFKISDLETGLERTGNQLKERIKLEAKLTSEAKIKDEIIANHGKELANLNQEISNCNVQNNDLRSKILQLNQSLNEVTQKNSETSKRNSYLELQLNLRNEKHLKESEENRRTISNIKRDLKLNVDLLEKSKAYCTQIVDQNHLLNEKNKSLQTTNRSIFEKLQNAAGRFIPFCPKTLDWINNLGNSEEIDPRDFSWLTIGDDPFEESVLDQALSIQGFDVATSYIDPVDCIVVGRSDAVFERILDYLESNTQSKPRIYSQELLAVFLMTASDPLNADEDILIEIGKTHPVILKLMDTPFEWPKFPSFGNKNIKEEFIITGDWDENSPLTAMGYHVGVHSLVSDSRRREILTKIFKGRLDTMRGFNQSNYEWGLPSSQKRLASIVKHITKNINLRKTNPSMKQAVREWTEDLKWMKRNFEKNVTNWPR